MNYKKAASGFMFLIVLVVALVSGIMYVVLNQVYDNYLFNQTTVDQVITTFPYANATEVVTAQTTAGYFWTSVPIFIIIMLILYMIVRSQTGKEE